MNLVYGNLILEDLFAKGRLAIVRSQQFGPKGEATIGTETWIYTAYVRASATPTTDIPTLSANMTTIQNGFAINGGDLKWVTDAGASTAHQLLNADTTNGNRVTRFEWLPGNPPAGEWTARRSMRAIVTGNKKLTGDGLIYYREIVDYIGTGGPRVVWRPSFTGRPQPQTTILETPVLCIQSGRAVGLSSYPQAAAPLFDTAYQKAEATHPITYGTPPEFGNSATGHEVRWRYVFEATQDILTRGTTPVLP